MIRGLLLVAILTGCSGIPDEEFYAQSNRAACWTVNGDPTLYSYTPAGQEKEECTLGRPAQPNERSERGME